MDARIETEKRDEAYRFYVADSLRAAPQNMYLVRRFEDILYPKPEDTRTAEEIAEEVIKRAGIKME